MTEHVRSIGECEVRAVPRARESSEGMPPVGNVVANLVTALVDDLMTDRDARLVHTLAGYRPPSYAQVSPTANNPISTVMARGYDSVHSVHRSY